MKRAAPAVLLLVLLGACAAPRCRNVAVQRVAGPAGSPDAVVFHRNCGDGASTEVAILPHEADLPDVPTSVLTLSDSVAVGARWTAPAALELSYPAASKVVVRVDRSDGIAVAYATR